MGEPDRTWKLLTVLVPTAGTVVCAALTAWANVRVAEISALANKAQATANGAADVTKALVASQPSHVAAPVQLKLKELEQIQAKPPAAFRQYVLRP